MERKQMEPYRPGNGTEGDYFMNKWCDRCVKDDPGNEVYCRILAASMAFDLKDEGYPRDTWVYFNGKPTCLAFKDRDDSTPEPPPVDPDQLDMFIELPVIG